MKITEDCINHNVHRLVNDLTEWLYDDMSDDPNAQNTRLATLAEIQGICKLAEAMKEVLRS